MLCHVGPILTHLTEIAGEATVAGTGVIRTRRGGGLTDSIVLARMIIARVLNYYKSQQRRYEKVLNIFTIQKTLGDLGTHMQPQHCTDINSQRFYR